MLQQRQTLVQRQRLSPRFYQTMGMMALPAQQLRAQIEEEVISNPALDLAELHDPAEISLNQISPATPLMASPSSSEDPAAERGPSPLENTLSRGPSLRDHLTEQLHMQPLSAAQIAIGETLIQNLDRNGFHIEPPFSLFQPKEHDSVERTMKIIRQLDPIGTCTDDYKHSLCTQAEILKEIAPPGATAEALWKNLDLLADRKRHEELASILKISLKELDSLALFVKSLSPYPGRSYSQERTTYVTPDLFVTKEEGTIKLTLNVLCSPLLRLNPHLSSLRVQGKDSQFIKQAVEKAKWFIDALKRREETLLKVGKSLLESQKRFFELGPLFLAPLTLKMVAKATELHEATVSRVVSGKYIQTEWGLFPLKYLFSSALPHTKAKEKLFSKNAVKEMIRFLSETDGTLSDQSVTNRLRERGVQIARRTVTKYRRELKIDSLRYRFQ